MNIIKYVLKIRIMKAGSKQLMDSIIKCIYLRIYIVNSVVFVDFLRKSSFFQKNVKYDCVSQNSLF